MSSVTNSIILGIDPGSRITGYGVVQFKNQRVHHVASGVISMSPKLEFNKRLYEIFLGIQKVIENFKPDKVSIEQVFTARNAASALKLGQARGAAIAAVSSYHLPISEYTPRSVKLAVTGYGAAEKNQVQQMIKRILNLKELPLSDAADALAIAVCCGHTR
jgi:crossover junction endodeoxyribonuclease RuvC